MRTHRASRTSAGNGWPVRLLSVAILTCIICCSTACDLLPGTREMQLLLEIQRTEGKWLSLDVDNYSIDVLSVHSVWHAQVHTIVVENGEVVDSSAWCIPAPTEDGECEVEPFDPQEYTVQGLFAIARQQAHLQDGRWTEIEFDPTYGFPSGIAFDDPEIVDEDSYWGVRAFEVAD